ncbi:hypothetical protein [Selenomonas sp. KH1T6]|uniref:hypothetical protein n=1 Tax=Selenomonas sp. KH1T6 TaxID=3158784 RepID=UPI0008A7BBF5|nr:hypothetical protein SAMN05216583_103184 [Selenomonas ruminantium]
MSEFVCLVSPGIIYAGEFVIEQVYNMLWYWRSPYCEAFSVETREEAAVLARQIYVARYASDPRLFDVPIMPIPTTLPFAVAEPSIYEVINGDCSLPMSGTLIENGQNDKSYSDVVVPVDGEQQVEFVQAGPLQYGFWSIAYVGGYAVVNNLEKLVGVLKEKRYAHAMWFSKADAASYWALRDYTDRFCRVYDVRDIDIHRLNHLLEVGESYDDPRFEGDGLEFSENVTLKKLRDYGFI